MKKVNNSEINGLFYVAGFLVIAYLVIQYWWVLLLIGIGYAMSRD